MSTIAGQLSERIRSEITMLQNVVAQILTGWKKVNRMPDEPAYLDSVALNLHGFYAGVKRLFELIARHIDQERLYDEPGS